MLFLNFDSFSQKRKKEEAAKPVAAVIPTAPKPEAPKSSTGPKPFKEIITMKAKTSSGLFTVHKVEDKYYFELADSILNREIMAITRYVKTPTGAGYGGEEANSEVIRFTKGPDNKVFLKLVSHINVSPDSSQKLAQAVANSNLEPIIASFDIKALRKDTSSVIDVSDFFKGDNQVFSLSPRDKQLLKLTSLAADRSYIEHIKSFPINVEVKTIKTFNTTPPSLVPSPVPVPGVVLPQGVRAGVVTAEMNTSFILLPKTPMKKRLWDARVGYFANRYTVYDDASHNSDTETFITRWRLEPKSAEDAEKQKRGEAIEPKKPIVYYIDKATPAKWVPYLILGINDWQKAFEKAGWKNAIIGKELTAADSLITTEDARYSFIRYFASNIENAYGPNVNDPRSGEILESHIGWYHNVMSLVYKWYLVQTAAADPRARKPKFDDELMGQLIRFVSSHEVGHTLGLPHNFGSSHASPVEKLRDKNWVAENGHTPSIMDYARFNYVAQPEDGVTDFFPRIGTYDNWSIEYGYKPIYDSDEKKTLNTWIKSHASDPRYFYGTQGNPYDPRSQSETIGDNNMKANDYGIKNLKKIVPNLISWLAEDGEDFEKLADVYKSVVDQYRRYLGHVLTNIGGIYDTPKTADQGSSVYEPTPKALQKDAMRFFNEHLFSTPKWLLDKAILTRITPGSGSDIIKSNQEIIINGLFDTGRLERIAQTNALYADSYMVTELFTDLKANIFTELATKSTIDNYRRTLQRIYVDKLISLLTPPPAVPQTAFNFPGFRVQPSPNADIKKSDIIALARYQLAQIKAECVSAKGGFSDILTKAHLEDIASRIENALNPK